MTEMMQRAVSVAATAWRSSERQVPEIFIQQSQSVYDSWLGCCRRLCRLGLGLAESGIL